MDVVADLEGSEFFGVVVVLGDDHFWVDGGWPVWVVDVWGWSEVLGLFLLLLLLLLFLGLLLELFDFVDDFLEFGEGSVDDFFLLLFFHGFSFVVLLVRGFGFVWCFEGRGS